MENYSCNIVDPQNILEDTEKLVFNCEIAKSEGCYLFDEKGNKYLDLTSNNDRMPLGYSIEFKTGGFHETDYLKSKDSYNLQTLIKEKSGFENTVLFSEKHLLYEFISKIIDSKPQNSVLKSSSENYCLDFTGKNIIKISLNDESAVKTFINKNTAAVIIQIAQIKDSVNLAENKYLLLLKEYCKKYKIPLIYDTSSISPLRLNKGLFNINEEVKPDMIIASRGLSAEKPVFAAIFNEDLYEKNKIKACSKTFSSACAEAVEFIKNTDNYIISIKETTDYIEKLFRELSQNHIGIADFISYGMLFELVTEIPSGKLVNEAFKKGIILIPLKNYKVLFCPPYNIDKKEIGKVIEIFEELFNELTPYDKL